MLFLLLHNTVYFTISPFSIFHFYLIRLTSSPFQPFTFPLLFCSFLFCTLPNLHYLCMHVTQTFLTYYYNLDVCQLCSTTQTLSWRRH